MTNLFFPLLGIIYHFQKSFKNENHSFAWVRKIINEKPNNKVNLVNFFDKPVIVLTNPKYVKNFMQNQQRYKK
jgi:hypothetical protein